MKNFIRKKEDFVCDPPSHKASEGRKNFVRRVESFTCENCGERVIGDGYTDHCPKCLWGRHVDESLPGDRSSKCGGMMQPVKTVYEKGKFRINYLCQKCNHEFWVREGKGDNRKMLIELGICV